jgi:serine/threonine protein kinase
MDSVEIDFDELEIQQWNNYGEEEPFSKLSTRLLANAVSNIADQQPFLDYSSFLAYVANSNVDTVPNAELKRLERLGFGATRTVFKATCPSRWSNVEVAIKRLNLEIPRTKSAVAANTEELYQHLAEASLELRVLSNSLLRYHPNIVDLLAISWEEMPIEQAHKHTKNTLYPFQASIRPILVVELAYDLYPTLEDYYRHAISHDEKIPADKKVSLLSDVADALTAVHTCGVVHGDIKPQNILIFRRQQHGSLVAKLSDFGGCKPPKNSGYDDSASKQMRFPYSLAGTEYWNAPEASSREDPAFGLETRDYYSFGLLVFYVLFEAPPFGDDGDDRDENLERIFAIKTDHVKMRDLLRIKFQSHWRLAGSQEGLRELTSVTKFYERHETLQKLFKSRQVKPHLP